ncbi:MAG: DUF368 domain-containing protein, partial [Candidatus Granulicatella sp. P6S_S16_bin.50.1]|nr:DUF368 domain-containing protein [Candidatus Granulicatella sp. P6S_S16_bin.50.1]
MEQRSTQHQLDKQKKNDWFLRFFKGMFIGSGFILPGVSGGALAAIFGLYERLIAFLANVTKDFKKNFLFFLPVGIGALAGIVVLSFGVSYLLGNFETIILWFFIGCIVGTIPALWKEAGKEGRSTREILILLASFIGGCVLLYLGEHAIGGSVEANFFTWMIAGGLIALGIIVPGLSPSNFIVYMGMYKQMSDGFKTLDMSVILPIALGGLVTLALFSKLVHYIFKKAYPQLFHFIFGIVLASTVMIIPTNYAGFDIVQYLACVV